MGTHERMCATNNSILYHENEAEKKAHSDNTHSVRAQPIRDRVKR